MASFVQIITSFDEITRTLIVKDAVILSNNKNF